MIAHPSGFRQHLSRIVEHVLDTTTEREIDMNIRKSLEQAMAAIVYGMALVTLTQGVFLMCLPVDRLVA